MTNIKFIECEYNLMNHYGQYFAITGYCPIKIRIKI